MTMPRHIINSYLHRYMDSSLTAKTCLMLGLLCTLISCGGNGNATEAPTSTSQTSTIYATDKPEDNSPDDAQSDSNSGDDTPAVENTTQTQESSSENTTTIAETLNTEPTTSEPSPPETNPHSTTEETTTTNEENTLGCEALVGSHYYALSLNEMGDNIDYIPLGHWRIAFSDNSEVDLSQSDFGIHGTFECRDQTVSFNFDGSNTDAEIIFSKDFSEFKYHPLKTQETLTYSRLRVTQQPIGACDRVLNKRYIPKDQPDFYNNNPEEGSGWFEFFANQKVSYASGDIINEGIYDCGMGILHIHKTAQDEEPKLASVSADGSALILIEGETTQEFVLAENKICTYDYRPVCALKIDHSPCLALPCPKSIYTTYANQCLANAAEATIAFDGPCNDLEGEQLTRNQAQACISLHDPVCAKTLSTTTCIQAPCETFEYKTYSNSCDAGADQGNIAFKGECSMMEGLASFSQPPIMLTNTLPQKKKDVTVISAGIENDVLKIHLTYKGCSAQHFEFYADADILKTIPKKDVLSFVPVITDDCDTQITSYHEYDLLPLKYHYQTTHASNTGKIVLESIAVYEF